MYTKYFFVILICILSLHFFFAIEQDQIENKLNESYLFSPIDNSETLLSSNQIIYQNQKYWEIETNNHDFFVINDKNIYLFPNTETQINILKTYFLYSKITTQNNSKIAYTLNAIPDTIFNFNYTLELTKKEIISENPDENVLIGIQNIQTRAINLNNEIVTLRNKLISLDSNLKSEAYENYLDIKKLKEEITKNVTDSTQKLNLLQRSITDLKIILVDANISTELKYQIGNNVLILPQNIAQIPEYISQINTNIDEISTALNYADESNMDQLEKNFEIRLKRINFLKKYLANDKDISTATKQKNAKELFDLIIVSTNEWKNNKETVAFVNAYNKMISDSAKGDYDVAERQLKPLKDSALIIFKDGKNTTNGNAPNNTSTTDQNTEEQNTNPIFTIALVCLGAIVLIIIVINIIKKVKESKEKQNKENNNEPEIEIKM